MQYINHKARSRFQLKEGLVELNWNILYDLTLIILHSQAGDIITTMQQAVDQGANKDTIIGATCRLDQQSLMSGFSTAGVAIQALSDSVTAASNGMRAWSASGDEDTKIRLFSSAFHGLAHFYVDPAVGVSTLTR